MCDFCALVAEFRAGLVWTPKIRLNDVQVGTGKDKKGLGAGALPSLTMRDDRLELSGATGRQEQAQFVKGREGRRHFDRAAVLTGFEGRGCRMGEQQAQCRGEDEQEALATRRGVVRLVSLRDGVMLASLPHPLLTPICSPGWRRAE